MNDFESVEDSYNAYIRTQAEANEGNKAIVFDALASAKITRVSVSFDGAGDSGQIEEIEAFIGDEQATIPKTTIGFENVS